MDLFAAFYEKPADWSALLPHLGLEDKRNVYVDKLSGGQRLRVFIALALLPTGGTALHRHSDRDRTFLQPSPASNLDKQGRWAILGSNQ